MIHVLRGMESMKKGSAAVLAALLFSACTQASGNEKAEGLKVKGKVSSEAGEVPAGAEFYKDSAYAVPHSIDAEGCEIFTMWRPDGLSQRMLFYRDGEGSFSPVKSEEGSCNATVVEAGPDAEGCPTFRAEQPDGTTTDAVYYALPAGGYTVAKERSNCAS